MSARYKIRKRPATEDVDEAYEVIDVDEADEPHRGVMTTHATRALALAAIAEYEKPPATP